MATRARAPWQAPVSPTMNVCPTSRVAPADIALGLSPSRLCSCCKQWKCKTSQPGPPSHSTLPALPWSASQSFLTSHLDEQVPIWGAQDPGQVGLLADVADPRWFLISTSITLLLAALMAMYISRPRGWADLSLVEVRPLRLTPPVFVAIS